MLAFLSCVHVEAFQVAKFELFTFNFGLNDGIDFDRVHATPADGDDVIDHGQGGDADAPLVLVDPLVFTETILAKRVYLDRALDVREN